MNVEERTRMLEVLGGIPDDALLEPVWNYTSPAGYYYAGAAGVEREQVAVILEELVAAGYAERVFVDRLSLCPSCEHHTLNVRETCVSCGSANLTQFRALFHFRCGFTGPEKAYDMEADGPRCPKCRRILRDLGTDYDSPGSFFECGTCMAAFQTPQIGGRCLSCGGRFDENAMQNVPQRDVFAYRITGKGRVALGR